MKWETKRFNQLMKITKGEPITRATSKEGCYPVILGGQEPAYYIDRYNHTGKAIVISRSGASAGYASLWNEPIFVTDGFIVDPLRDNNFEYTYYLLKYYGKALRDLQNGAAIPHVTPKTIYSLKAFVPPMSEQERIAKALQSYDRLIETNSKRIRTLEQMAENLYKEWFVRFRFPGHETAEFINGIPKGWEYARFADVYNCIRGVSYSSDEIECEDGINLINLKNIQGYGGFRNDGTKRFSGKYKDEQLVKFKDLVMGVTDMTQDRRTVGHVALIPDIEGVISADLVILKSQINSLFSYCLFRYGAYSQYISQFGNGANVIHLKPSLIKNVKLLFPSADLLCRFVRIVDNVFDSIDLLNKESVNLAKQRDLLLPRLMSGKLEV